MTEETRKMLNRINGTFAWTVYAVLLLAFFAACGGAAALSLYEKHGPAISCRIG